MFFRRFTFHLETPYDVTRKGLGVIINNKMIERPVRWPVDIPSGDENPVLPPEINRETSMYDEVFKNYWIKKAAYLRKHYTREKERQIMEQVFRKLPFVTEAALDEKDPSRFYVTTTDGRTFPIQLISFRGREVNYDYDSILQRVERKREYFQDNLKKGGCYFLSSAKGYKTRLSLLSVKTKLPHMIKILQSSKSSVEKSKQIRKFYEGISDGLLGELINNFSASPQLEKRLNKLVGQKKVNQKTKEK